MKVSLTTVPVVPATPAEPSFPYLAGGTLTQTIFLVRAYSEREEEFRSCVTLVRGPDPNPYQAGNLAEVPFRNLVPLKPGVQVILEND